MCVDPTVYMQVRGSAAGDGLGEPLASFPRCCWPHQRAWRRVSAPLASYDSRPGLTLRNVAIRFMLQMGSFFVEQGAYMRRDIALPGGGTFTIPSASLG